MGDSPRIGVFRLDNQVAIVTGAGRGLGKGVALALAEVGANVVVASRTASDVEKTAEEIEARGGRAVAIPTDVRDNGQIANLVTRTAESFGTIDILVNVAGGTVKFMALDMSENRFDQALDLNLRSVFFCSKEVAKHMIGAGKNGAIINIASVAGLHSTVGLSHYGAAKAGVINLTHTLAIEWAKYGIRVNAIAPGYFVTEGTLKNYESMPEVRQRQQEMIPMGRLGQPGEIGNVAIFLASSASSYITGETIFVSGGLRALVPAGIEEHL